MKHDKWEQLVFVKDVRNQADFRPVTALPVSVGHAAFFSGSHIEIKQFRTQEMPVFNCCSSS